MFTTIILLISYFYSASWGLKYLSMLSSLTMIFLRNLWTQPVHKFMWLHILLRSGVIDYQNELIMPTFFTCNFAILLVKILKSHPCPKWSRVSPQPNETKPKRTSGFIIHVVKGFEWWFVDLGFIFWFIDYSLVNWKVEKKQKIIFDDLVNLYLKFGHN